MLRIAYIHSRLNLNDAPLRFMPFGLSTLKLLKQAGHRIDLFLAESPNSSYQNLAEKVHFLSARWLWERPGKVSYWLLHAYFDWWHRSRRSKYDLVVASGQAGCALARALSERIGAPLVCLNDEFPNVYEVPIWREAEARALRQAQLIVVPDESRFEQLCVQVQGLENRAWVTLPNAPLLRDLENLPQVNWAERFQLPPDTQLWLQAGGLFDFNQIAESMVSVREWPELAKLLINGRENVYNPFSAYDHLWDPEKMRFSNQLLDDPEFHSLVTHSVGSFGLYRNLANLDRVGKSSGKIMRSLACSRPVIASRLPSLQFIEELGLGCLVRHPREIPEAVRTITDKQAWYVENCQKVYTSQLSFEVYWRTFCQELSRSGICV
jgi:hypothetical protein